MVPRSLISAVLLSCALCAGLSLYPSRQSLAQEASSTPGADLATAYNGAMQAFQAGSWPEAAQGLEQVIRMMTDEKQQVQLAPIYFTLGAAYFNVPNYPKSIEVFHRYVEKFPHAEKISEVRLAIARAYFFNKEYEKAISAYQVVEMLPGYRDQALTAQAQAYRELQKPDDEIRLLERLIDPEIRTPLQANGGIRLVELYAEKGQPEKAVTLLVKLQAKSALVENLVALNAIAVKLGDEFAEKKLYKEAIEAYRAVRMREQVIKAQSDRITAMSKRMEANLKAAQGNPQAMVTAIQTNHEIRAAQEGAKQLLAEFEKLPDFAPTLLFRMGKCWYDWDRKWEAAVVYDRILKRYPQSAEREPALFAALVSRAELNQTASCQALCDQYLKEFPEGPNAGTVGYLSGAVALQANDPQGAESFFGTMLEQQPQSEYREVMRYLLGNAKFMQGKYDEALVEYEKYLKEFPAGENLEEIEYRSALAQVFMGKFEPALAALNAYLGKYPSGEFVPDAKYRVMVCKYAAQLYDEVIADVKSWQQTYAGNSIEGEVLALLGDSLAAQNKEEEAIPAYVDSFKKATSDEVINYSLFEAGKHLQKLGKWPEVSRMFEEFVKGRPDHPSAVGAMYWIGKARAREGKTEEAKAFLVDTLKRFIAEPKREAVEQLLQQLAQLCSKRPKPKSPPPEAADTLEPAVNPTTPAAFDPVAELDRWLEPLGKDASSVTKARLLYAQAELAQLRRKPSEREQIFLQIATRFEAHELSPVLLAHVGDFLLMRGEADRAAGFFTRLKEDFPKSDYLDVAYVGLAELAYAGKNYEKALELFTHALDNVAASFKLKEATVGKAKTLLELGKFDDSRKLFEQVASVREWRGESTAQAVFSLGEIEARQGRWAEAIAHYQRVFVAYQKFVPWVAKAYLRSADAFERLGKRQEAVNHLREMLRKEKLQNTPEASTARAMLEKWGTNV